jgi:H+/Cl- antiporter ClcA/predicted transcriptional regulator
MFVNEPGSLGQKFLNRLQDSGNSIVLLSALVIGVCTGSAVVSFRWLIEHIRDFAFESLDDSLGISRRLLVVMIPLLGGIMVGLVRRYLQDLGPNLAGMLAASQIGEKTQPWRGIFKTLAAAISLGTGASLGPEGPSVEIGANFGMLFGQLLKVSQERQRLLLAAGAAAGVAAGFNSPIAGVFFALEVVLKNTISNSSVSVVVLAAVISSLVEQVGVGSQPAFKLPVYEVRSAAELPLYLGLGVSISLLSFAFMIAIQWSRNFFQGRYESFTWMAKLPMGITPAVGGLLVGVVALKFPQILGIGYETVEAMLQDVGFSMNLLISLVVVKLLMTAISVGSGLVGGLFAPSMFLGACVGTAYAKGLVLLIPVLDDGMAAPPAYAMVGMAAMLATTARAPLTAILLMFELTRDYRIVLPLMACVSLSMWLVDRLSLGVNTPSKSLDQLDPTALDNLPVTELVPDQLTVSAIMTKEWLTLSEDLSVLVAARQLVDKNCRSALVADLAGQPLGIVTIEDINRSFAPHAISPASLRAICSQHLLYAHPEELVVTALDRMTGRGLQQLPVIKKGNPQQIVGVLYRESIGSACSLAIARIHIEKHAAAGIPENQSSLSSLPT